MPRWLLLGLLWPGPAERQAAIDGLRTDPTYQRDLPAPDAGSTPPPATPKPPSERRRGWNETNEGVVGTLFWIIIGLSGVAVLVVLAREVTTRPVRARSESPAPMAVVKLEAATLDDAEVLAQQGLFAEAIHVLLLRTFAALGRQARLPDALTSREILARVALQSEARAALGHLVQAVEVSFFGHAEPGPEEYARCRESYRAVTAARGVVVA